MAIKFSTKTSQKRISRFKKKMRIRKNILGTTERPRLTVFKSLSHLYVQLVDDTVGKTLTACSSLEKELQGQNTKEGAKKIGALIAKRAQEKNIQTIVFDRNGYRYHGKIKEIADAIREGGLKF